jgi:AcrR family transcriptional regulator
MAKTIGVPRNARGQRTRDALLAATREILETSGFEALTMAAVAERAGVSRRAVYLHATSRADLVNELFEYIAQEEGLAESAGRVWAAPDSEAALREWVRHLTTYHPRVMAVDRAIERVRRVDDDAQRHRDVVTEAQLSNCRRVVTWLEREGRLAPQWSVETAVDLLFGLICSELVERLTELRSWTIEDLEQNLWKLLRSTLVREPAQDVPSSPQEITRSG